MQYLKSLSSVLFPPLCVSCGEQLNAQYSTFCAACMQELTLLGAEGRCHRCFYPKEGHAPCPYCRELPSALRQQAVCFNESQETSQLTSLFRQGIAVTAAAGYMVVQLEKLHWPLPDLVVPTPGDWFEGQKKWGVRKLLAKELALIVQKPYANCIHLKRHQLPIRYESLESQPTFTKALYASTKATNKVVLLVHDSYKTGRAIALATQTLSNIGARSIYAMSLFSDASSFL